MRYFILVLAIIIILFRKISVIRTDSFFKKTANQILNLPVVSNTVP